MTVGSSMYTRRERRMTFLAFFFTLTILPLWPRLWPVQADSVCSRMVRAEVRVGAARAEVLRKVAATSPNTIFFIQHSLKKHQRGHPKVPSLSLLPAIVPPSHEAMMATTVVPVG